MAAGATTGGRPSLAMAYMGVDMPSRRADAEYTNAAATEWVNRALRYQDSLFTPGKAIWTAELLSELRTRFLDHPDDTKDPFYTKVRRQLAGSEPEEPPPSWTGSRGYCSKTWKFRATWLKDWILAWRESAPGSPRDSPIMSAT